MLPSEFQIRTEDGHIEFNKISELSQLLSYFQRYDMDDAGSTIAKVSFYWSDPFHSLILRRNKMNWFVPDYEYSSHGSREDLDGVYDAIMNVPGLFERFGVCIQWD